MRNSILTKITIGLLTLAVFGITGFDIMFRTHRNAGLGASAQPAKLTKSGVYQTKNAPETTSPTELAGFAAGCFWGVEEEFRKEKGVVGTAVGYTGGHTANPTYEDVCGHGTGHAETVLVEYDPKVVSYDHLLKIFWDMHDPTTLNRQGPDFGDQYRSAVFYYTPEQQKAALASKDKLQNSGEMRDKIVTEIVQATKFYNAEEYHQQYVEKGGIAFCHRRK